MNLIKQVWVITLSEHREVKNMSSVFGTNIKISIFGESHSPAIGVTIEGLPAGEKINMDDLNEFMQRRAPGKDKRSTARKEADIPEFLSGIRDDVTCGTPVTAIIRNSDVRSQDYDDMKNIPRPGHADYPAHVKYGGNEDYRGGGNFSGRLTAPLCIAGGMLKQILGRKGITIDAKIDEIHGVKITDDASYERAMEEIDKAREEGDSVGGIVSCVIKGLPAGLGDPMFGGVENVISQAVFAIPAVKGIEFGRGFDASRIKGSENNDPFSIDKDGKVVTLTNNHGGALGGLTSGMPVTFRAAFKPTPSIAKKQQSIDYRTGEETELIVKGRHDPCVVVRAVPLVEAAAAAAVAQFCL